MKVTHCLSVLIYVTIAVGLPIRVLLTGGTATTVSQGNEVSRTQMPLTVKDSTTRPTFQQYIARLRSESQATSNTGKTTMASRNQSHPQLHSSHYGSFVGKPIFKDDPQDAATSPAEQTCTSSRITYLEPADLLDVIDKHGPESVALGLFVLVPMAYFILELLELAIKSCTRERYPHRGRDRVHLVGPERQIRTWSNRERQMLVESEKHWWQTQRAR